MGEYLVYGRTASSSALYVDVHLGAAAAAAAAVTTSLGTPSLQRWEGAQAGLVLNGSGFTPASVVSVGGAARTTNYVSATQLTFNLLASDLFQVGALSVTADGSNPQTLTVSQATSYVMAAYRADLGRTMNGSGVQVWADQSGRGDANRNLTQVTAGAQPQYVASDAVYNGQATLAFDDAARWMKTGVWAAPVPVRPYRYYLVGHSNDVNTYFMEGLANTNYFNKQGAGVKMGAGGTERIWNNQDLSVKHISVADWNLSGGAYARNAKTFDTIGSSGSVGAGTITGITLGGYSGDPGNPLYSLNGSISEILIVDSSIVTPEQHGQLMDYLGARYAITIGP